MFRDRVFVILFMVLAWRRDDRLLPVLVLIYRLSTHTFVVCVIVSRGTTWQIFVLKGLFQRNRRDSVRFALDIVMAGAVGDAAGHPLLFFVALENPAIVLLRIGSQLHHHSIFTFILFKVWAIIFSLFIWLLTMQVVMARGGTVQAILNPLLVIIWSEQFRPIHSLVYLSANDAQKANQYCKDKNHEHSSRPIKEARLRFSLCLFQYPRFFEWNRRIYFFLKFRLRMSKLSGHGRGYSVSQNQ